MRECDQWKKTENCKWRETQNWEEKAKLNKKAFKQLKLRRKSGRNIKGTTENKTESKWKKEDGFERKEYMKEM